MPDTFDRPKPNPHTPEQLATLRCRHRYRVAKAAWQALTTRPPTQPGGRNSLATRCLECGATRILYAEPLQPGEYLALVDGPAHEAGVIAEESEAPPPGVIVDETAAAPAEDAELTLRRGRERR